MDAYRQNLGKQIEHTYKQIGDSFENPNDPTARIVHHELEEARRLALDGHGLRDVHHRLQTAQRLIHESRSLEGNQKLMSIDHVNNYTNYLQHMQDDIHKHPDFN